MKIGKNLRNLVMKQEETLMLSQTSCIYLGEKYTFPKVTRIEKLNFIKQVKDILAGNKQL